MKNLIEKIVTLPYLRLSPLEWEFFLDLIAPLETINDQTFHQALTEKQNINETIPLSEELIIDLINYLQAWSETCQELFEFNKYIEKSWQSVTQSDPANDDLPRHILNNDALLSITMMLGLKLITADLEPKLPLIKSKIEQAIRIRENGLTAFCLTNLWYVFEFKQTKKSLPVEDNQHILSTVEFIEKETLLKELIASITEYENQLFSLIRSQLMTSNFNTYLDLFFTSPNDKPKEKIDIINSLLNLPIPTLQPLAEKCLIVIDIRNGLIHSKASASQKLIEFAAKFDWHIKILIDEKSSDMASVIKQKAFSFFSRENKEHPFIQMGLDISSSHAQILRLGA